MKPIRSAVLAAALALCWQAPEITRAATLQLQHAGTNSLLTVSGDKDDEWRIQTSPDLTSWTDAALAPVLGDGQTVLSSAQFPSSHGFFRAVKTGGLFDPTHLRGITLTFSNSSWANLLATARTSGGNMPSGLALDNGTVLTNVGARYKGNTSYTLGGAKKSINLDINYTNQDARLMGYRAVNLNNAAGDESLMREPVYFNIMREYAPSPHGAWASVWINGANWGVYSMVDQLNNDLLDEWFTGHEGDRWRAPNMAGGGGPGGGGSGSSAFGYLGTNVASYRSYYELKSDDTNAWTRLVNAIVTLNSADATNLRDTAEQVFAVDRWLWFLAVENVFVDDDSYWNKGADYAFYYEPESGRIHPVEHDGNESFTSAQGLTYTLSPVQGATSTTRPLLYRFLSNNDLRQRYLAHMRTVLEERFNPAYLTPKINEYHRLIATALVADPKKNFTMAAYTNEVTALKQYITNRYNYLKTNGELTPLPPVIQAVSGPTNRPAPTEIPTITANVQPAGTNGISSVWLYWRDKPYGRFSSTAMLDDGAHGDGASGDGVFGASTTNYPAGHKIHYYVEARSANSKQAAAFSPARAEQETYSYRVALTYASNSPVVINEWMADNVSTLADPQGDFDDWIELRNVTDQALDLGGRYLSDEPNNPRKWQFPTGTVIPADGYLLVWADEDGKDTPGLHASFKLSAGGEQIFLTDTDANGNAVLDFVEFGPQATDRSYGRSAEDADVLVQMDPTPGAANK